MKNSSGALSTQERLYKTMRNAGIGNLVFGILMIVVGVTAGVLSIVTGAKLLRSKSKILF